MRKPLPVFRRSLADSWRSLLGWTVGVVAVLALYLPLYPSIGGDGQIQQIIESMPPELVNTLGFSGIGSGAGYTQATFFGLIGFLLLTIAATSWGASAIGGAEESGRLELALAHGVGRARYALESALSILVRLLWLGLVATLLILALDGPSELGLSASDVVAAVSALLGLTFLIGAAALAVGAIAGRQSIGTLAGAAIAVAGYVLNAIANQVSDADAIRAASPYAWAYQDDPLVNGADPAGLAALWGVGLVLVALATFALRRRDVTG
ncbi:MAG TPA: ABC transporter permease subunit [Pseudolysinimonas sp.]|nr:ABC transporter permease subunit [Pseudolysinimonas sp.]